MREWEAREESSKGNLRFLSTEGSSGDSIRFAIGESSPVKVKCSLTNSMRTPRIRDLADKRLYIHGDAKQYPTLAGLIGGSVNIKHIRAHWDEILRLAASIKQGTVTASLMLRKLFVIIRRLSPLAR